MTNQKQKRKQGTSTNPELPLYSYYINIPKLTGPEHPSGSGLVNQPSFYKRSPYNYLHRITQEINMVKREIKAKTTFIRLPEVIKRTGFGKTWIYELIKAGRFPSQVKTGIRAVAFIESEIDEWIEATIRNSRQNAA